MGVESRGTIAEAEFLGEIIDPEKLASKEKKLKERLGWLTQDQLMDNVKEFQPGNPSDPEKQFPGDIFALIAEKITPDDYDRLRYYTAVTRKEDIVLKSRLDYCEGVDFFFEFERVCRACRSCNSLCFRIPLRHAHRRKFCIFPFHRRCIVCHERRRDSGYIEGAQCA